MLRSFIACCVIGSCLALTGCEQPKPTDKPVENAPAGAAKDAPKVEDAAKPADTKAATGKDKTRKKKAPHVTTAK
jgi:hypothetical protein